MTTSQGAYTAAAEALANDQEVTQSFEHTAGVAIDAAVGTGELFWRSSVEKMLAQGANTALSGLLENNKRLQAELDSAREVIAFYADPENWSAAHETGRAHVLAPVSEWEFEGIPYEFDNGKTALAFVEKSVAAHQQPGDEK